jgi:hypothetical protein
MTNPHTHFYLDVKDDKGAVANWKFRLSSQRAIPDRLEEGRHHEDGTP